MAWAAAIGAAASLASSGMSAALSANQASIQRKFIRQMDNTKYQRTMADMKKAGLNPILVSRQSPTSAGAAAMGQTPDFASAMSSGAKAGVEIYQAKKKKDLTTAQVELTDEQREKTKAEKQIVESGIASAKAKSDFDQTSEGQALIQAQRAGELMPKAVQGEAYKRAADWFDGKGKAPRGAGQKGVPMKSVPKFKLNKSVPKRSKRQRIPKRKRGRN